MRKLKDSLAVRPLCFRLTSLFCTSHLRLLALDLMRFSTGMRFLMALRLVVWRKLLFLMLLWALKSVDLGADGFSLRSASTYFVSSHSFI
jgi:hypothetical protein